MFLTYRKNEEKESDQKSRAVLKKYKYWVLNIIFIYK